MYVTTSFYLVVVFNIKQGTRLPPAHCSGHHRASNNQHFVCPIAVFLHTANSAASRGGITEAKHGLTLGSMRPYRFFVALEHFKELYFLRNLHATPKQLIFMNLCRCVFTCWSSGVQGSRPFQSLNVLVCVVTLSRDY